jgi:trans-AT polyketide synthase, acyltransferase and oxidoreductase domains
VQDSFVNVFLFPGQGSQSQGMGAGLFDEVEEFKQQEAAVDRFLGYSIRELCLEDPAQGRLNNTQYTQPALYVVNALYYWKRIGDGAEKPAYVAGHSVGEYNALLAAGAFDFLTGVQLVRKRGELMSQARNGGMVAVVGLKPDQISQLIEKHGLAGIDVANYNAPSQTVISGPVEEIDRAREVMESAGAQLSMRLPVSAAFHSRYMVEAETAFREFVASFEFHPLKIPVISNVTARPYPAGDSAAIKVLLTQQISRPVQWTDTIRYLKGRGATNFSEVGPGAVLSGLLRRIEREAQPIVEAELPDQVTTPVELQPERRERPEPAPATITIPEQTATDVSRQSTANHDAVKPNGRITAEAFGSAEFRADYRVRYAYVAGGISHGVSSKEMVVAMGRAGLIGYLGAAGVEPPELESNIRFIQAALKRGEAYGVSLLASAAESTLEEQTVELLLRLGVRNVEAVNYMRIPACLARFRFKGSKRQANGEFIVQSRILARASRPEVAMLFMQPAPEELVKELTTEGHLTPEEAAVARSMPMSDDICATADCGGHTDQGVAAALLPTISALRDEVMARYRYPKRIRVGVAGGIGTPQAIAAMFIMGADFALTSSVNYCTVEAATSEAVKDMLQAINVQDTAYAPDGDIFDVGAKVQVLRRGVFFPARANRLYALYQQYDSLDTIDAKTRRQIEETYFKRSFDEVWEEMKARLTKTNHREVDLAEQNPKHKMRLVFRWYFDQSARLAKVGDIAQRVNFQVHCSPALGAFNQWVKDTQLADWRQRHVADIAERLLTGAAELLNERFASLTTH